MPLLWLRFATILYGVGLLYALLLLTRRGDWLSRIAVPAVGFGMVLHFVSLTEIAVLNGYLMLLTIRHAESALALLKEGLPYFLNSLFGVIYYRIDSVMLSLMIR